MDSIVTLMVYRTDTEIEPQPSFIQCLQLCAIFLFLQEEKGAGWGGVGA